MNLTTQFVEDYREIERARDDHAAMVVELRRELAQLEEAYRIEKAGRNEGLRTDRDRLARENEQLRRDVRLWKNRHDDLARE